MMVWIYEVIFHNCNKVSIYPSVNCVQTHITILHNEIMCFLKIPVSLDVKSVLSWAAALGHCCESLTSYSSCQPNHIKWSFWRIKEFLFRIAGCGGQYNKNFYMRRIIIPGWRPLSLKVNRQQPNDYTYLSLHTLPALIKIKPKWFYKHNASGKSEVCTWIMSRFHVLCTAMLSSYWFLVVPSIHGL
jgi:hypothetical protein